MEDLDAYERRFCEGLELLATGSHNAPWHKRPLGNGGAQLTYSHRRARTSGAFIPATLRVQAAVMGRLAQDDIDEVRGWSRRPMQPGEVGIVQVERGVLAPCARAGLGMVARA